MHIRLAQIAALGLVTLAGGAWAQAPAAAAAPDPALIAKATAGDPAAQVALGQAYATGKGVPQDAKQAAAWYRKAADQGFIEGEKALGALYRDGAGKSFPRDPVQGAYWYLKAADQGDPESQGIMGVLYSYGQGVAQNYVEAYYWLDLAASVPGPRQAQYAANRQMVGQHITADELEAIQERVAQWKAAHPR
ncbi:MAG: tetratricopeptide repeat protein [Terracidiphilus sp.]